MRSVASVASATLALTATLTVAAAAAPPVTTVINVIGGAV